MESRQANASKRRAVKPRLTMSGKEILELALKLKPDERFSMIEALLRSLDTPDAALDELWADEAEKRLQAYRAGKLAGVPFDEVFAEH